MLLKIAIGILLLLTAIQLFRGAFYMVQDQGQSTRTVSSLTWRIGLSITVFALLIIGTQKGILQPHGITTANNHIKLIRLPSKELGQT